MISSDSEKMFSCDFSYKGEKYRVEIFTDGGAVLKRGTSLKARGTWAGSYVSWVDEYSYDPKLLDTIDSYLRNKLPIQAKWLWQKSFLKTDDQGRARKLSSLGGNSFNLED